MTNARDGILSRIRKSRQSGPDDGARRAAVSERLRLHPTGVIPARGQVTGKARVDLFVERAERAFATVTRVASAEEVPGVVAAHLRSKNLPQTIRRGADPFLAGLPFDREPQLTVSVGASDGRDLVGLSHAFCGIAETGTAMLLSRSEEHTSELQSH